MSSPRSELLHPGLLDQRYWGARLEQISRVPQRLLLLPRPDLAQPGIEALELCFRSHDGLRLSALLLRSSFRPDRQGLRLCPQCLLDPRQWTPPSDRSAELFFDPPATRRLEDRVLDLLRAVRAALSLPDLDPERIEMAPPAASQPMRDDLRIAEGLILRGLAQ